MKKYYLILIFLLGILVISSCQTKTQEPQIQENTQTPPQENPQVPQQEPQKQTPSSSKEFIVEGDDLGLYPDTLTVNKGDQVKITFKVRTDKVYYGGLDFRSDVWDDTGKVLPGATKTVEFTAQQTFNYKSYWPSTTRLKATGTVNVM